MVQVRIILVNRGMAIMVLMALMALMARVLHGIHGVAHHPTHLSGVLQEAVHGAAQVQVAQVQVAQVDMEVREAVHGAVLEALVDGGHHLFPHLDHIDGTMDLLDPMVDLMDPMVDLMDLMVDLMDHMDGILEILTVFQAIEVWKVVDST